VTIGKEKKKRFEEKKKKKLPICARNKKKVGRTDTVALCEGE